MTTTVHLVPTLGICGAVRLLPPVFLRRVDRDNFTFLGAFTKLRKATVGSVMSARLSVVVEQLGSSGRDFN